MNTGQLRQTFLNYFMERGHTVVPGSALIPGNDSSLLFTNSGMVQFKGIFLGLEKCAYTRATTNQRCVRVGGKHNDLDNVGYTDRHHTFFEMLGNFSFGDYFKREAIQYAWEFLTKVLKLPEARLWVTVHEKDDETADIWLNEIQIDQSRFSRCGEKDNFWSMGETGPCGPCTELYYDHGPSIPGGPPGSDGEEGGRYVEIWNLVFMQYNRSEKGELMPLAMPCVDTGMGLERIAAIMQGVYSNYEIDIFRYLMDAIMALGQITDRDNQSLRVIADHIRSCAFLVIDGVVPSNEGRGYVLRRICRRAIRHGHRLGFKAPFFHKLVKPLTNIMGDAYPELVKLMDYVERTLLQEERQFAGTLDQGMKILEETMAQVSGTILPGEMIFRLYDTYGFPVDLTADIAREQGMTVDQVGFEAAMAKQRARAREASQFSTTVSDHFKMPYATVFTGYETLEGEDVILAIYQGGDSRLELNAGESGGIVLGQTPFYAEAGGQVGDQGILRFEGGEFEVQTTHKLGQTYLHLGVVTQGKLGLNQKVQSIVDFEKRRATEANHSATHLLHAALRQVCGLHVKQKGSLVEAHRLRFDFTHFEPLTAEQIRSVERQVNHQIRLNTEVRTKIMPIEQALEAGAVALFGEKYNTSVRVLEMGDQFSIELCGGTHVSRTGEIGLFKITAQGSVAAGVRRLEAVTGEKALAFIDSLQDEWEGVLGLLKCAREGVSLKIQQLLNKTLKLEKELQTLKLQWLQGARQEEGGYHLAQEARDIKGVKVLAITVPTADHKILREMADRLKNQLKTAVIVLASVQEGKVNLVSSVTADCTARIPAGELVKDIARFVGGQGGGRPDMAQGGGTNPAVLEEALASVFGWVENRL